MTVFRKGGIVIAIGLSNMPNVGVGATPPGGSGSTQDPVTLTLVVSKPKPILYYVPFTITNNASAATPAPFQQMITVNPSLYTSYLASDLSNVQWFDASGNVINSWLESGNSNTGTKAVYWLSLANGIAADSSITVYMGIASTTTNLLNNTTTGEAPQLSPTYGEYDNGASVFNFYDNFAGTSLKSSWSIFLSQYAGTVTVNNGLTLSGGTNWWGLENSYQAPMPSILEFYGENTESSGSGIGPGIGTYNGAGYLMRYPAWCIQNTVNGVPTNLLACSSNGTANYNVWYLTSGVYNSGSLSLMVNYTTVASYSLTVSSSNLELITFENSTSVFQYARVRAYPPNGVMPAISAGSLATA